MTMGWMGCRPRKTSSSKKHLKNGVNRFLWKKEMIPNLETIIIRGELLIDGSGMGLKA